MATPAFIGLMSGTSMDGIDAVLVSFCDGRVEIHGTHSHPYPEPLAKRLRDLSQNEGSLDDFGEADHQLGDLFAEAALAVIGKAPLPASQIRAIGSHGQTLRHQPSSRLPFTLQIGNPAIIAEKTDIPVVADFRRRDMAAGGQGAPLAPAFHQAFLGKPGQNRCILNLGGIGNITWLPGHKAQPVTGFDTGPGNALLDAWSMKIQKRSFDENGRWARAGQVNDALLNAMLRDDYFALPPPKSTGKEHFNLAWIDRMIADFPGIPAENVQRTLLELTLRSVLAQLPDRDCRMYVCGGGAFNDYLMERLRTSMPTGTVETTSVLGLDPAWVEGVAFAWLAQRFLENEPGNLPDVTGASGTRILGSLFPA